MTTSARDRLNTLFTSQRGIPLPDPQQSPVTDSGPELKKNEQQKWRIPDIAQHPRQATLETPPPTRNIDCLSSSDEDDYVTAFSKKPTMKAPGQKPHTGLPHHVMPEPNALHHSKDSYLRPEKRSEHVSAVTASNAAPFGEVDGISISESESWITADEMGNPLTGRFCQFGLVAKFPYKYMIDSNDRVSRHFFANNKFYDRIWDIYCLHPPTSLGTKPIILVPHSQVQQLVDEISQTFETNVHVPSSPLTLTFFDDGTPQPQFLGISRSRADFNDMQASIPPAPEHHGESPSDAIPALERSFAAFQTKCEKALAANKKKGAAKRKKDGDRFLAIQAWHLQLKRAQQYLGLRPRTTKPEEPDPHLSWGEQEQFRMQQLTSGPLLLDQLDVHTPAPHQFDKEPVIVAVDIESYERDHSLITEVGVSTLDTLDLVGVAPGPGGENWSQQIRSRHFRIKGREYLVNKDFCIGDPNAFQFGESEFVEVSESAAVVDSCFEWPFSVQFKDVGCQRAWQDDATTAAVGHALSDVESSIPASALTGQRNQRPVPVQKGPKDRNLLVVGHDIRADLAYLEKLGSKIFNSRSASMDPITAMTITVNGEDGSKTRRSIIEALDTAILYRNLKKEPQIRSLASILADLGQCGWHMHNGGNDARYTLEALIAMVIKARLEDGEEKADQT